VQLILDSIDCTLHVLRVVVFCHVSFLVVGVVGVVVVVVLDI